MSFKAQTLPLSFMQDFKPERMLIAKLLAFVRDDGSGDKHYISNQTGIPTGQSSGKVEPMIYYATGMGLIESRKKGNEWQLTLTDLGNVVLREDPFLSERVSLWLLHLMLCRPLAEDSSKQVGVVPPWYNLFIEGVTRMGASFSAEDYLAFMRECFGDSSNRKGMVNLILKSYIEDSCLGLTRALRVSLSGNEEIYARNPAPKDIEFYPAYTAYLILLWEQLYPKREQLQLDEFFQRAGVLTALNWSQNDAKAWLDWAADHGILQLDRQTGQTLALRTASLTVVLASIYSELV